MFNVKYLTMNNVQMHAGTIRKLLYGFVWAIIHVDYFTIHTHKLKHKITSDH